MRQRIGYNHLTKEQRYTIEVLLQTPMSLKEIGEVIGVSAGTVSREIRRNCDMRGYHRYRWQLACTAIEALLPYKDKRHTITADNRKEFARHKEIAKGLDAEFYFARPYHSWERGANENTNGLIRQYIPKGTDFGELTDEMLAEIEWKLNHRPRKSLGYRTPLEYCKQMFNFDF